MVVQLRWRRLLSLIKATNRQALADVAVAPRELVLMPHQSESIARHGEQTVNGCKTINSFFYLQCLNPEDPGLFF